MSACIEQEITEDQVLADSHKMLKYLCENRQPCLDQLEQAAVECKSESALDNFPAGITMDPHVQVAVGFQTCIFEQMDQAFMAKFNQMFPVTETEVSITRPHLNDPKVLKIEEVIVKLKILNQLMDVAKVEAFITDNKLAERYHSVLFVADKNGDVGIMVEVMDIKKKVGFSQTSITTNKQ